MIKASYGDGTAIGVGRRMAERHGPPVVITRPTPWRLVEPGFGIEPRAVALVTDLERPSLQRLLGELPDAPVMGVGGGTAVDAAKWVAWQRSSPLWLVPSLPSVDASFMRSVAVREAGGVHYEGDARTELVIIDYSLMRQAPAHLARAGIGDVVSCHTAIWDWRYAAERGHQPTWDPLVADQAAGIVDRLVGLAPEIQARSDVGIHGLMESFRLVGRLIDENGHARFEEGSEHFFAYVLEQVTGRSFMHGEVVSLGTVIMSELQGNDPAVAQAIVDEAGVRYRPAELGIGWEDVVAALRLLGSYAREHELWYSVANDVKIDADVLVRLRSMLDT